MQYLQLIYDNEADWNKLGSGRRLDLRRLPLSSAALQRCDLGRQQAGLWPSAYSLTARLRSLPPSAHSHSRARRLRRQNKNTSFQEPLRSLDKRDSSICPNSL
jgi:hypothetical protein